MEKARYQDMLPHEIVARRQRFPAAFIGVGGLEWHGEHLAVGNDGLKAEKLCELAAKRSGGFAFPTLWYGEPRTYVLAEADENLPLLAKTKLKKHKFTERYFGKTNKQSVEFFQRLISHVLTQMNQLEMRAVCLVCGHYPLAFWASPAVRDFNRNFRDTKAFAATEVGYPGKSRYVGGDHGAKWETSYLWYLRPDCVDMTVFLGRERENLIGVGGIDPRKEASIEVGRKACDLIVEGMIRKAKGLIRQAKSRK